MKSERLLLMLVFTTGMLNLWAPSGRGNNKATYPFDFDTKTWEEFQTTVIIQNPYKFNGPKVQFGPLIAYLYLQYWLLKDLKEVFATANELDNFLTLNHVSHTIVPTSVGQSYKVIFESNILGIRKPSAAVQAAAPLLGKTIGDTMAPSQFLQWLKLKKGLPYVKEYLNLVYLYLINQKNAFQSADNYAPNYLAPHLWIKMDTEGFSIPKGEEFEDTDPQLFKGTLFDPRPKN